MTHESSSPQIQEQIPQHLEAYFSDAMYNPNGNNYQKLDSDPENPASVILEESLKGLGLDESSADANNVYGIVKAGEEVFGIVKRPNTDEEVEQFGTKERVFLTHFSKDGKTMEDISPINQGESVQIGRTVGNGLSSTTSAKHFRIDVMNGEKGPVAVIGDLGSTNGTELVTSSVVKQEIISEVPKFEAATPAPQPEIAEVKVTRESLHQEIKDITDGLSEDDKVNLWRYSSGILSKREAQQRGDGQESVNQGQKSGEGYRDMSQDARDIASKYHELFSRMDRSEK